MKSQRSKTFRKRIPAARHITTGSLVVFLILIQVLLNCCRAEVPVGSYGSGSNPNASGKGNLWSKDGDGYSNYNCHTGDLQPVLLDKTTGTYSVVEQQLQENDADLTLLAHNTVLDESEVKPQSPGRTDWNLQQTNSLNSSKERIAANNPWGRRRLRGASGEGLSIEAPVFVSPSKHTAQRRLSTDGSDSFVTGKSDQGNADDISNYSTSEIYLLRPCLCSVSGQDAYVSTAFCPESSDWCSWVVNEDTGERALGCYSMDRDEAVAANGWPLVWLMYTAIMLSFCCTFQGRILLDFIRGTILYYVCGCGDRLGNRQMRSINRYNQVVVQEILDEERLDRETVRQRRRATRQGRQMNTIAAANLNDTEVDTVPPTITTTRTNPNDYDDDDDTDRDLASDSVDSASAVSRIFHRALERFRNVVWPWQTSWNHYIKYNLMLRVEWMAIRDEIAFIESRQERGLPHARYEMKTRRWSPKPACDGASCSAASSSLNSVDEPHCTICFVELEDGDRVGNLNCVHVFHADCLKMWVQKRNSCPLCTIPIAHRRRISSEELVKKVDAEAEHENRRHGAEMIDTEDAAIVSGTVPSNSGTDFRTSPHQNSILASPSNQNPRLSHMPLTPSTVAANTYNSFEEEMGSVGDQSSLSSDNDNGDTFHSNGSAVPIENHPTLDQDHFTRDLHVSTPSTETNSNITRDTEDHFTDDVVNVEHQRGNSSIATEEFTPIDVVGDSPGTFTPPLPSSSSASRNVHSHNPDQSSVTVGGAYFDDESENGIADMRSPPRQLRRRGFEPTTSTVFPPSSVDDSDKQNETNATVDGIDIPPLVGNPHVQSTHTVETAEQSLQGVDDDTGKPAHEDIQGEGEED